MKSEFGVAVHALVYLSHHKNAMVSSEILAKNTCTNPARIRKIMASLRKKGLIDAKEGADGGYFFPGNPAQITLAAICGALNAEIVTTPRPSGDVDMDCLIASGMGGVMNEIYKELNIIGMRHLTHLTIQDIENQIFNRRVNENETI